MRSKMVSFLYFVAIVIVVTVVLKSADLLPSLFQAGTLQRYDSIESLRSKLNIKDLSVPTYFPQTISWPAAKILGQTRPFVDIFLVFNRAGATDPTLTIRQTSSSATVEDPVIRMKDIRESVSYPLKNRTAVLIVGSCEDAAPCSRISWKENGYTLSVAMKSPPFEVIKIAESMIR